MKKKQLIARLIKYIVIMAILLAAMATALYFLGDYRDSLDKEIRKMKSGANKKNSDFKKLEKEVLSSEDAYDFYVDFSGTKDSKDGSYRREYIREVLSEIKQDISLNDLLFTVEPFTESDQDDLKRNRAVIVFSEVKLQFSAIDDQRIQRMIKQIEEKFPGSVYFTKFNIERKSAITDDILLRIGRGDIPDIVKGALEFKWGGIKVLEEDEIKDIKEEKNEFVF